MCAQVGRYTTVRHTSLTTEAPVLRGFFVLWQPLIFIVTLLDELFDVKSPWIMRGLAHFVSAFDNKLDVKFIRTAWCEPIDYRVSRPRLGLHSHVIAYSIAIFRNPSQPVILNASLTKLCEAQRKLIAGATEHPRGAVLIPHIKSLICLGRTRISM